MKINRIQFKHVRIPLRVRFAQANQNTSYSDNVIVRIQTKAGTVGYGEACPRPYVTGEDAASVKKCLAVWWKELAHKQFTDLDDIAAWTALQLQEGRGTAAVCAIELALLDAWSKEYQQDLYTRVEGVKSVQPVQYSGVVPYGEWERLAPRLAHFAFPAWKFKAYADLASNWQRIHDLRAQFGSNISLRMDANAGWTPAMARRQIDQALEQGVNTFEQPLQPHEEESAIALTREYGEQAAIMADESLCTYGDAQHLIATGQCNQFSIKLSKNGGLLNSLRIYRLARENGISCQLSAHYGETSILSAAGHLFASLVPELTACEGALGTFLLKEDIAEQAFMIDARGKINNNDFSFRGWPIRIDPQQIEHFSSPSLEYKALAN